MHILEVCFERGGNLHAAKGQRTVKRRLCPLTMRKSEVLVLPQRISFRHGRVISA